MQVSKMMGRNTATHTTIAKRYKKNPVNVQREHEASVAHVQSPATWSDVHHVRNAASHDIYTAAAPELRC